MAASVLYKAAAEAEIDDAFGTYEQQRLGLGLEFLDELARIEGHLRANPALYQRIEGHQLAGDLRRAVLRRFPYGLFYVVEAGQVIVLACFHLHRDPQSREELLRAR
jgi:toxin ParE1/3/4